MKRLAITLLASLLWCHVCSAQISVESKSVKTITKTTPTIVTQVVTADGSAIGSPSTTTGETVVKDGQPAVLMMLTTTRPIGELLVKPKCKTADVEMLEAGVYIVRTPGTHEIEFNVIGQNPLTWDDETVTVDVGGVIPDPVDPEDEDAQVGDNFRVLIVTESSDLSSLPFSQQQILVAAKVREYLDKKCVKIQGQPEWKMWDQDTDVSNCNTKLCDMLRQDRGGELPWLIMSNDKAQYSGPLPKTIDEFLALAKQYGGE